MGKKPIQSLDEPRNLSWADWKSYDRDAGRGILAQSGNLIRRDKLITVWLEGIDVTVVFLTGIIIGIILGQYLTFVFLRINERLRRKKRKRLEEQNKCSLKKNKN